jgi:hypothetical protein
MMTSVSRLNGQGFEPRIEIVSSDYRAAPDFSRRNAASPDFLKKSGASDAGGFSRFGDRQRALDFHFSSFPIRRNCSGW